VVKNTSTAFSTSRRRIFIAAEMTLTTRGRNEWNGRNRTKREAVRGEVEDRLTGESNT
jgi:hypothetical protein